MLKHTFIFALLATLALSAQAWHIDTKQCPDEHKVLPVIRTDVVRTNVNVPCIRIPISKTLEQPVEIPIHIHAHVPIEADIILPLRLPLTLPITGTVDVPVDVAVGTNIDVPVTVPFNQRVDVRTHVEQKPVSYTASLKCFRDCTAGHKVCAEKCKPAVLA